MIPKLLMISEVSEALRKHPRTVRRLLATGEIKGTRLRSPDGRPGNWRISEESVLAYLHRGGYRDRHGPAVRRQVDQELAQLEDILRP